MTIYLGLGANLGDRRNNLTRAIDCLAARGVAPLRVSPVVESAALVPEASPDDWNLPYLNLVLECETGLSPRDLLTVCKRIEAELGRIHSERWSPRPIDIDILLYHDEIVDAAGLTIPHPDMQLRNFVLVPLAALDPELTIPGRGRETVLAHSQKLEQRIPLWMGIVNLTPDSFSDGGQLTDTPSIEAHVDAMLDAGAHSIDLGAESTRPGAQPLTATQELARLEPTLECLAAKYRNQWLRPRLSVDTYHPEVARRALELGVDIINDVSGLGTPEMLDLAESSKAEWIAMHQLGLPADPTRTLPKNEAPGDQLERWLEARLKLWERAGIERRRIIFDPGIGFGKTARQSLELLRHPERFARFGLRQLIGHSRKSFIGSFHDAAPMERDLATLGLSLHLIERGVDILRVHNVAAHTTAYRAWVQARS